MATVKISQLPALTGANTAATDVIPIVDVSGNITNKITREEFFKNIQSDVEIADKIVHSGDTNTAIRFPAADTVTVETSGAERLRVTSAGNVGIGTTAPAFSSGSGLEVERTDSNATIRLQRAGTSPSSMELRSGVNSGEIFVTSVSPLLFATAGTERMRIDSSGNVGIGTTTPASRLNVSGDQIVVSGTSGTAGLGLQIKGTALTAIPTAQVQGYIATGDSGIGTAGDLLIAPRTNTTASVRFITGTTPTERMRIDASGNVYFGNGVNVASPANSGLFATNGSGTDIAGASMTIQAGRGTGAGAGGSLIFNTAAAGTTGTTLNSATERMRITSTGNVGIGTSSPAAKLDVSGGVIADNVSVENASSVSGSGMWGTTTTLAFNTGSTERMRITSTGNVGIGTTTPAGLLEVFDVLTVPARNTLTITNKRGLSIYNNQSAGAVDTTLAYGNTVNSYLAFGHHNGTSYAERMRIDAVGNVGIGTTSPSTRLHVSGDTTFGGATVETVFALTGTTPALNPSNGTIQTWTLSGNSSPTDSFVAGEGITLMIDDGTAFTITWPSVTWVNNGGVAPTLKTTGYTVVALWKVSTVLYGALVGNGT